MLRLALVTLLAGLWRSVASEAVSHVLHGRNVFMCGFGKSSHFASNFLQPSHLHSHKHIRNVPFANASSADVVVVYGVMPHCQAACANFTGLVIYIDNEAGRPSVTAFLSKFTQQNFANMIYLGVPTIDLPSTVTKIPCISGVQSLAWSSETARRVFSRHALPASKTRFLAYAASKCLSMREHMFSALVKLSIEYNLGSVTAYGSCHGSPPYANYSHTQTISTSNRSDHNHVIGTSRRYFGNNGILFQPFKYVLAMENDNIDFYMTEKIFYAYQAGAIPLYWGASNIVRDMFHPDTFILIDPSNVQAAFDRILEIERDPALYRRILQTPVLLHGEETLKKYFAVGIPPSLAADPRLFNASISNRIWAAIIQHLQPLPSPGSG